MNKSVPDHNQPEVIFFDDFSAPQLNPSNWNIRVTGTIANREQQAYVNSPKTIYLQSSDQSPDASSGGILVIQALNQPNFITPEGEQFDFISGRIDTRDKFDFQYGTAAARIKLPIGRGLWPAFWAMGYDQWPENGEIDIMESVGDPGWTSAGIHGPGYSGENGLINHFYLRPPDNIAGWHTYSVEWSPRQFHFYVDWRLIYRVTAEMALFFGPWVFDNPKYLILNLALGGKFPFKINGVASPYYGLPEDSIEIIQEDQARMMIDWVKVTKFEKNS
jgi:beta-glucanase (GH16 family)